MSICGGLTVSGIDKHKLSRRSLLNVLSLTGYPLHRENRENGQKYSLSGKTQGIWKFCQNTEESWGIWFAQVVNSLIL